MRSPLTIAVAQPACTPRGVAANAAAHAAAVRAARSRVVIFPEMSLTGYGLDAPAVTADDPRLRPLVEACADTGSLALAGAPVAAGAGEGTHIATLAVDGAGARVAYRKMFLGGDEPDRFTPGREPVVLDVDGWRLGLAICKDTGVPRHAAATAALGIDVYAVGVLEHAHDTRVIDERMRRVAGDHKVFVAVASFAGAAGGGYARGAGRSRICAPSGDVIAQAGAEPGDLASATLK
ncbi:hydrolase [Actinomadura rubrobrunea]|uniref:Hydrolase n=1 Tax=Actinomadura rubrobrunea TaxID=115335 RepID=A0A9W6PWP0_9ACTN|nr:carbon-nitrogen hydrolase family protein [Actinomadura rubrobrunea]GLW65092.1 hydrolase [Actinomadura rubrobrunea]